MKTLPIHPAAELLPLMTDAEFAALKEDIAANGLREPIARLAGALLDGRHRLSVCEELGIEPTFVDLPADTDPVAFVYSKAVHRNLTESQKAAAAVAILDARQTETKARSLANLKQNAKQPWPVNCTVRVDGADMRVKEYRNGNVTLAEGHGKGERKLTMAVEDLKQLLGDDAPAAEVETLPPGTKARDVVGNLFGVSGRYIDEARKVRDADPKLFQEVFNGTLTLPRAKRQVHRTEKRKRIEKLIASVPPDQDVKSHFDLRHGDCLKILPTLPRRHYRLVVADPPYNIGIDYGKGAKADLRPPKDYLDWCQRWISECVEVLTPDGAMWVIINDEWAAEFVILLKTAGLYMRAWVKWYETFGNNCQNNFNRTSRHLLYFIKDPAKFVFNAEAVNRRSDRQAKYGDARANPAGKNWDDVWIIPRLVDNAPERLPDFPTQLPEALITPIVACCTEPHDEVLDPFNGSGTTGAVCQAITFASGKRRYTGIDVSKTFLDASRRRIVAAAAEAHVSKRPNRP